MIVSMDIFNDISDYLGKREVGTFINQLYKYDQTYLFLDDNKERTALFARFFPWALKCEHAKDMIDLITNNPDSIVFLDHDLDGRVYVDASESNTGSEVVRFILKNKPRIKTIVIHTMNNRVNAKMRDDLLESGYDAFNIGFEYMKIMFERIEKTTKPEKI